MVRELNRLGSHISKESTLLRIRMKSKFEIGTPIPNGDEGEAEDVIPQDSQFQFVDLTATSMTQQNRNRTIVRSHVMRAIRRSQRRKKDQLRPKPIELNSGAKVKSTGKALDASTSSSNMTLPIRQAEHRLQRRAVLANQVLSRSTWAGNSSKLSLSSIMDSIIGPSTIYQGKVTPFFHQLIEFCKVKKLLSFG